MDSDKRATERAKRRVMVRYGLEKADRTGFTMNLSETGLFVKTNNVFKPGVTLQIELAFPDRTINLWGRVMWAKRVPAQLAHVLPCGMGIHFIDPTPEWLEFFDTWKS